MLCPPTDDRFLWALSTSHTIPLVKKKRKKKKQALSTALAASISYNNITLIALLAIVENQRKAFASTVPLDSHLPGGIETD